MDWPVFILITYGFFLLLLLALLILRSRKNTHSRYAQKLEEKEQKLLRMQIDIEETMEGLEAYAAQLQSDWRDMAKRDHDAVQRLFQKQIETESGLLELRANVKAIGMGLQAQSLQGAIASKSICAPAPKGAQEEAPLDAAKNASAEQEHAREPEKDANALTHERIRAMIEHGHDEAEIAQSLNLSTTEVLLALSAMQRERATRQPVEKREEAREEAQPQTEREQALLLMSQGISDVEIAKRFSLSHTELSLLRTQL